MNENGNFWIGSCDHGGARATTIPIPIPICTMDNRKQTDGMPKQSRLYE